MSDSWGSLRVEVIEERIWNWSGEKLEASVPTWGQLDANGRRSVVAIFAQLCDETLVLAIQKRFFAKEAFGVLLAERYTQRLYQWFFLWGVDAHEADDLKQEIFLKFWIGQLKGMDPAQGCFSHYLHRSAYHLWVQRVYRPRRGRPLEAAGALVAPGPSPLGTAVAGECTALVEQIIDSIPDLVGAEVIRLRMNGVEAGETAMRLNTDITRVYRLLFKTRQYVRDALRQRGYDIV